MPHAAPRSRARRALGVVSWRIGRCIVVPGRRIVARWVSCGRLCHRAPPAPPPPCRDTKIVSQHSTLVTRKLRAVSRALLMCRSSTTPYRRALGAVSQLVSRVVSRHKTTFVRPEKIPIFWKNGKMVISVKT